MKNDKYILRIKQLLFTVVTIILFCLLCVNDYFNPNVNLTENVVIANEIETSVRITAILLILAGAVSCLKGNGNEPLSLKDTKWKLAVFVSLLRKSYRHNTVYNS
ncbi:MAG: hypothetical protein LBP63_01000 [Prevotellaceae bacterium]|jgi:hypothetical protein|nr:hypothetical protein [Prevotellaceae bacterium]